jgi:HAD superfamily hydrolase (TIGR01509 family)
MAVKALIFDFDGLIIDTETPHHQAWSELYARHDVELPLEQWLLDIGTHGMFDPCANLEELLGRTIDHEATRAERRAYYISLCEREPLRPGVPELLAAAKKAGLKLAVASSSSRDWVERWLERHALRHYFSCVRTRDDVERVKPAPDLFLSAAECLNVAPADCVVFEDSPNGMRAAASSGMRCVAVPNKMTASLELPAVALRLESLGDHTLDQLIERLEVAAVEQAG